MSEVVLLGDEAVAQGALDAGISGCYAYPGTPSTEIMEYVQRAPETLERGVHAQWSSNEKTAMEAALGMSYAGKRSLVCMKHVGLNVAADGFVNAAITGANGGVVVTVADDPSMHSSQNEQDSRFYAQFAHVPCLEPSNQQEAYDMMAFALDLSEKQSIPVLVRITTRLAHSRANVRPGPVRAENSLALPEDQRQYVLLPGNARRSYSRLLDKQPGFVQLSEDSPFNRVIDGPDRSLGIVASGIAFNYVMEAFGGKAPGHPVLKVSQYPVPPRQLRQLIESCERVLVVEEGNPFIESMLHGPLGLASNVLGRMTGHLPREGELAPDVVARALGIPLAAAHQAPAFVAQRPPRLCQGCPHCETYQVLLEVLKDVGTRNVMSDIGCYTLGALPPYNAISSCVDMGASISMAKGAADAGMRPAVAVIGDSTFTHSGMTPLLDAVWEQSPIKVLILDNGTTGMTGGQDSPATGRLVEIVTGLGVPPEHVRVIDPFPKNHAENVDIMRQEILEYDGLSVIIAERECIQTRRRTTKHG